MCPSSNFSETLVSTHMYFTQNLPYRKWVKITQMWYGRKWVKVSFGVEVRVWWGCDAVCLFT